VVHQEDRRRCPVSALLQAVFYSDGRFGTVYTAVRVCLDEWQDGVLRHIEFKHDTYFKIYEAHCKKLRQLKAEDASATDCLGTWAFKKSMGKYLQEEEEDVPGLTQDELQADLVYARERQQRLDAGQSEESEDDDDDDHDA